MLTVLYDAECQLCRGAAARLRRLDRWNQIELIPVQDDSVPRRFPALDRQRALTAMAAIDARGIVFGVDAYARIGALLPRWRRVAWLLRVPGLHALAAAAYSAVARNRYRWNREACADTACRRHAG